MFDWILDQGYYSERDTSNVIRQVMEAVAYLHSLKIVHRNLKVQHTALPSGGHPCTLNFSYLTPLPTMFVSNGQFCFGLISDFFVVMHKLLESCLYVNIVYYF